MPTKKQKSVFRTVINFLRTSRASGDIAAHENILNGVLSHPSLSYREERTQGSGGIFARTVFLSAAVFFSFLLIVSVPESRAEDVGFTVIHSGNVNGYLFACPT